ncbi:MAG TPA: acyl-CoA dehydrogenase family protein [Sphingobium sp.]|nr:acyl-CoA dehydrogenase family protein [Sphingobium sp.]
MEGWEDDLAVLSESIADVLSGECDRLAVHDFFDAKNDLDHKLWATAAEQGWLGLGLPEASGGLGFGARGLDVLFRQLGRVMAPGDFLPTLAAGQWLSEVAPAELKDRLLAELIAGKCSFAVPLALDGAAMPLTGGRLSGTSPLLLGARTPRCALLAVEQDGQRAIAIVELEGGAAFEQADFWDHTRAVGRLTLNGVAPLALIADEDGSATALLRRWIALGVSGESVGGARAITEQTIDYLKERVQFGKALASFQALKHRAADLMTAVIHAENMLDQAVESAADEAPSANMWANLAKASATEKFKFVAEDCVQLHGGVGFTWEFDAHIFLKRALLNREIGGNAATLRDLAEKDLAAATLAGATTAELTL